jgi:hypothetical protein
MKKHYLIRFWPALALLGFAFMMSSCQVEEEFTDSGEIGVRMTSQSAAPSSKITICHIPPGNPANAHSITISQSAWQAHQAHGDTQGPCNNSNDGCGTPGEGDIFDQNLADIGDISVANDEDNLYVTFTLDPGLEMSSSYLYVGDCNSIPASFLNFPQNSTHNPTVSSFTYTIDLTTLDSCYCIGAHAIVNYDATSCPVVIDFNTDGNGNPLLAGTVLNNQWSNFGLNIVVDNAAPGKPDVGCTFDSGNPTGNDFDLGTPNAAFNGAGIGAGGGMGMPGQNDFAYGNLAIIAENIVDNNNDGRIDDPDDEAAGGSITFNFNVPVNFESIVLVDLDDGTSGTVIFADQNNVQTSISIPDLGENSTWKVMVNLNNITTLTVNFASSGAIAEIRFCPEVETQTSVVNYCTQICCVVPVVVPGDDLSDYDCSPNPNNQKVIICHLPPGNPQNAQTICIDPSALPAHVIEYKPTSNPCLGHHSGCHLGPCDPCGPGSSYEQRYQFAQDFAAANNCAIGNGGGNGNN